MEHRAFRNLAGFFIVLVLTVFTVYALSMATAAKTGTAPARYSQEVRASQAPAATELSANVAEEGISPVLSVGAFALILSVSGTGLAFFMKARRQGAGREERPGRRYRPEADRTFRAAGSARTRV